MNSSPKVPTIDGLRFGEMVLRGARADTATEARFDIDLRGDIVTAHKNARENETLCQTKAHAAGYAAGWAEGRQAAAIEAKHEAELVTAETRLQAEHEATRVEQALIAVAQAANDLDQHTTPTIEEFEDLIVSTAFALAEAIVGRELAIATQPGADAIARSLSVAPAQGPITVYLNPSDLETIEELSGTSGELTINGRTVTIIANPEIQPGDSIAICDATTVEARISAALHRVQEAIFGAST